MPTPLISDTFNPPSNSDDAHQQKARTEQIARLHHLLASLERGERPAFALVYQPQGNAPKFSWGTTANSHAENLGVLGTMIVCLDSLRAEVAEAARHSRLAWRQEEEDAAMVSR